MTKQIVCTIRKLQMDEVNVKSQNTTSGRSESECENIWSRMERIQANGCNDGTGQIGATEENNSWGHSIRECANLGENDFGKIIERLDKLQEEHLAYLHSHQSRLKTRLTESEVQELKFLDKANQIRADIYDLVASKE
jgi:hypothetical protein